MENQVFHKVTVCMGSSCFAHGNQIILEHVQKFLAENADKVKVDLVGSLCQGNCKEGPVMVVDGKLYTRLTVDKALETLKLLFKLTGKGNE